MANATPTRSGQINAVGGSFANDNALFLKVWAGEVLTAFKTACVMLSLTMVRTIQHGKSAQFPKMWKASALYHTPGAELNGSQIIKGNERIITIDDLLVSDVFVANIDEAKQHYDVRSHYSFEQGQALARSIDKNLLQLGVLAARSASDFTGGDGFGGSQLTNAAYDTTADALAQGIYDALQVLDEKDVPETDRVVVLRPKHYNLLMQSTKSINRDFNPNTDNGAYADGKVFRIGGATIIKSNQLPNSNVTAIAGQQNTYAVDATHTVALVCHKSVVGTVKLLDMAMESEYTAWRQGTLMVAKMAVGHGILRPEAAVELKKL